MSDPVASATPASTGPADGKAYITYTDRLGNVHVVDSKDQVPSEFHDSMRVIAVPETGSDASIAEVKGAVDNIVSESRKKFDESLTAGSPTTAAGFDVPSIGVGAGAGIAIALVVGRMLKRMKIMPYAGLVILGAAICIASLLVGQFLRDAEREAMRQRTATVAGSLPKTEPADTDATVRDEPRMRLPSENAPPPTAADAAAPAPEPAKEPAKPKKKRKKKRKR